MPEVRKKEQYSTTTYCIEKAQLLVLHLHYSNAGTQFTN